MRRRSMLAACAAVLVSVAAGCERKAPVAASTGPRLAVLSPALAATLKDLGAGPVIVGRHAWDQVLDASVPIVGDGVGEVDYERLVGVKPTVVIGQFGAGGVPARLTEMAKSRGWTLRDYNPLSLADVVGVARSLAADAQAAGCAGVPERLAEVEKALESSLRPRPGAERAGRVLLLAGLSPPAALGPGSVHHDILVSLGATPAITTGAAYITLDAEDLKRIAPDAILLILPRKAGEPAGKAKPVAELPTVPVALIDDPLTHLTATTIRATADAMGEAIDRFGRR